MTRIADHFNRRNVHQEMSANEPILWLKWRGVSCSAGGGFICVVEDVEFHSTYGQSLGRARFKFKNDFGRL